MGGRGASSGGGGGGGGTSSGEGTGGAGGGGGGKESKVELPPLMQAKMQGSEKQIAWAKDIRSAYIAKRRGEIDAYLKNGKEFFARQLHDTLNTELKHGDAGWWIKHRHGF